MSDCHWQRIHALNNESFNIVLQLKNQINKKRQKKQIHFKVMLYWIFIEHIIICRFYNDICRMVKEHKEGLDFQMDLEETETMEVI